MSLSLTSPEGSNPLGFLPSHAEGVIVPGRNLQLETQLPLPIPLFLLVLLVKQYHNAIYSWLIPIYGRILDGFTVALLPLSISEVYIPCSAISLFLVDQATISRIQALTNPRRCIYSICGLSNLDAHPSTWDILRFVEGDLIFFSPWSIHYLGNL